jgi:hypothetical protein
MTWEEYFDSRFIEAIKLGKLFVEEVGEERAYKIIAEKTFENETEFGKEIKGNKTLNSKEDLSQIFKELFESTYFKNSNDIEILDNSEEGFNYIVHNCIWAHIFRKHEAADLGFHMICHGDYGIANGLGKHVDLRRTMTLMQGDAYCDMMWLWKGE